MLPALDPLLEGDTPFAYVPKASESFDPPSSILLPGSFNPLHHGHEGLLRTAERLTGRSGVLELSIANVDKPELGRSEILRRLGRLAGRWPVVMTRAPTFLEKASLFPGCWFAMGFDTAIRLLSSAYHADISTMLTRFVETRTRFVVAGRLHESAFKTLEQLHIPAGFEELFVPLYADTFRADVSSTELRGG